jgi:tRNA-splicing ligase RtcB (3'-phosphate/5'-hydroxy nucleic acid ligase)
LESVISSERVPIKLWAREHEIEAEALQQAKDIANLPFIHKHVAFMSDIHVGLGCPIGAVVPTKGAIVPAICGVDLGCGVRFIKLSINYEQFVQRMANVVFPNIVYQHDLTRNLIESAVPHGRSDHGGANDVGAWNKDKIPVEVRATYYEKLNFEDTKHDILRRHPGLLGGFVNTVRHLGTLGTGNHYSELCVDEDDNVWLVIHSGSRGIGNRIGSYFIKLAKELNKKWFIDLPNPDLAYFPQDTQEFKDYWECMKWAQKFARLNRELMAKKVLEAIQLTSRVEKEYDCHHNFAQFENHHNQNIIVTRKGATSAREGEMGIIPGSMGAKSFIVKGKGEPLSFNSCSHGAGRKMSRAAARDSFTLEQFKEQTAGVSSRKEDSLLDEIPGAYKCIDDVMSLQNDLVEIKHTLKQFVCVKG